MEPFGIGNLYLQPGKTGEYFEVAVLQDITWDFRFDLKELHGAYQFPVSVRRGKGTIEGSASYARIRSNVIATILGGLDANGLPNASVDGQTKTGQESFVIPATPWQKVVTPADAASTVLYDVGVWYESGANLGQQLTQVAATPAAGEYTFTVGTLTYLFNTADEAETVKAIYAYDTVTATLLGDRSIAISNEPLGETPIMRGLFRTYDNERQFVLELEQVVPGGIKFASAIDDWTKNDLPMRAFADCNNLIGKISVTDTEAC